MALQFSSSLWLFLAANCQRLNFLEYVFCVGNPLPLYNRPLGLHWFRRGFGRGVVHVELGVLVKLIQTN